MTCCGGDVGWLFDIFASFTFPNFTFTMETGLVGLFFTFQSLNFTRKNGKTGGNFAIFTFTRKTSREAGI
jgi:hypothetical protein